MLIGFENIKSKLQDSYQQNRLHHAIMLCGKNGIGKASFAKEFALEILQAGKNTHHPDLLLIEREEDKKEISVAKIREIAKFFNQTSAISKNKFIIINSADELNRSSANALLKILEEPNNNNFLILISHSISKSLPTICSRCQIIKINDLNFDNFSKIIKEKIPDISLQQIKILSEICDNSVAKAINYGQDLSWIYEALLSSLNEKIIDENLIKKLSDKKFDFNNFIEIVDFFFLRFIKYLYGKIDFFIFEEKEVFQNLQNKFNVDKIFQIKDEATSGLMKATSLNLDKKLAVIIIFNLLQCPIDFQDFI